MQTPWRIHKAGTELPEAYIMEMQLQAQLPQAMAGFVVRTFCKELLGLMPLQALFGEMAKECSAHIRLFHAHESLGHCRAHTSF